jgi:hypothetical protein
MKKNQPEDTEMRDEYDFSRGVKGKYADRFRQGSNVVVLDPDLADVFTDSDSVNQALRVLAELIRQRSNTSAEG